MLSNNSAPQYSDFKSLEVDPSSPKRSRGPGEFVSSFPPPTEMVSAPVCEPSASSIAGFQPRPFPPPSLTGVPVEYIYEQLRNLAPAYWDTPDTADCTIIVPIPDLRSKPVTRFPLDSSMHINGHGLGRRVSEPILHSVPRITIKLHIDYLSAHSALLRGLFSGASPLDLINTSFDPTGTNTPADRSPRLLPCSPSHPILFLPLPDPSSFHLLAHWMYFGSTEYIAEALSEGTVQWEGIARNVEYLGLSTDIKIFLGKWYGNWLHTGRSRLDYEEAYEADDDSDTAYDSDEDFDGDCSTSSDMEFDEPEEKVPERGRTRELRRLSSITSRIDSL
ncbi:BTB domain-containing protein [Pleurotus pulmonarius]